MTAPHGADRAGSILMGTSLSAGQVTGRALWVQQENWMHSPRRIERAGVARELNVLRHALQCAQREAQESMQVLARVIPSLPTGTRERLQDHLHALSDAVWIADVESLVLAEHLDARSAVHKVIAEAQRAAQVVGAKEHRSRARRLSGVGRCVLDGLDSGEEVPGLSVSRAGVVLLAKDPLLLADLLPAGPTRPAAVVCTAGQLEEDLVHWLQARGVAAVELGAGNPIPFRTGDRLVVTAEQPGLGARVSHDTTQRDPVTA